MERRAVRAIDSALPPGVLRAPAEPGLAIAIAALLVALPRPSLAQRVSEGADVAARGTLEVETDYAQIWSDSAVANSGAALLKYSLSDSLQLQLGTNNLITVQSGASTQLLDGVYLGSKLVLRDQGEIAPSIAVSAMVMLPTRDGDAALTQTVDTYLCAYASKNVLGLHTDLNLGLNVLPVHHNTPRAPPARHRARPRRAPPAHRARGGGGGAAGGGPAGGGGAEGTLGPRLRS